MLLSIIASVIALLLLIARWRVAGEPAARSRQLELPEAIRPVNQTVSPRATVKEPPAFVRRKRRTDAMTMWTSQAKIKSRCNINRQKPADSIAKRMTITVIVFVARPVPSLSTANCRHFRGISYLLFLI